jgi:acetolactate synthase I/II/III large subunit
MIGASPAKDLQVRALQFGLYPAAVQQALASCGDGSADGFFRALLTEPSGRPDGLALALLRGADTARLVGEAARCLRCPAAEVGAALRCHLDRTATDDLALTGAEVVTLLLREAGVRTAFAYAGTSELALCDNLARAPGIELVNSRGDKEAAFMAAGGSLLHAVRSVAVLHGARGSTNAAGAIADARRNEVGVVIVLGLPSSRSARFLPPHGEANLMEGIGAFAKSWHEAGPPPADPAARAELAGDFVAALTAALRQARTRPHGPAVFGLPQDVAESAWVPWHALADADPGRRDLPRPLLAAAAGLLASGERVAILIDDYLLRYDGARPVLAELAARSGAVVLQVRYRRGAMLFERLSARDVPSFLGWYDPLRADHRDLLDRADLLVTLEDRNLYQRVVGDLPPCRKLAITSDAAKTRKNRYLSDADLLLEGDVVAIMRALCQRLPRPDGAERQGGRARLAGVVPAGGTDMTGAMKGPVPTGRPVGGWVNRIPAGPEVDADGLPREVRRLRLGIVAALAGAMDEFPTPVLVDDSQMFGGLICEHYDLLPGSLRVFGDHAGFVGSGIACATGLALVNPSVRVFCTLGDQGFSNGMQGLMAAGQERARVVYMVCNNGESASLLAQSAASQPRWFDGGRQPHLRNPATVDYTEVARGLGVASWSLQLPLDPDKAVMDRALERLRRLLSEAVAVTGPALIELRLPGGHEAWAGIWLTQGHDERSGDVQSLAPPR